MKLLAALLAIPLLAVAGGLALLAAAVEDAPRVRAGPPLTAADLQRARDVLAAHDPRGLPDGTRRQLVLSPGDLSLIARYLARDLAGARAHVELLHGAVRLEATRRLPRSPLGTHLNVLLEVAVAEDGGLAPRALHIGSLQVPPRLAGAAAAALAPRLPEPLALLPELARALRSADVTPERLRLAYAWHGDLLEELRAGLLPAAVRGAIAPHQRRLTALLEDQPGGPVPLGRLLAGMLAGAPAPDADPVAANRALLLVLGAHAAGRDLELLVPELARAGAPPPVPVTAHGRVDLAQHFLISAAIAALGTPELADAIGLEKEIRDATRGSGFSFTDLAADRAGTRFGEWITASRAQARQARSRLRAGKLATADVLPRVEGLPEFLSARDFERRYGAVGSAAYQAEARRIEARLDALAWYDGPPS